MNIVTHTSPDWDAIGGVWLLKRFGGLADRDVVFVSTGNPDRGVLITADAVVDTGRVYNPNDLRFDHHQLGRAASDTCATLQVFCHLTNGGDCNHPLFYLNQIAALITAGDTGHKTDGADWSRIQGIHALLSAQKARRLGDAELMEWGFGILDLLAESSKTRYAAQATLAAHTVYTSDDGLVVALHNAPQGVTFAAHEAGARLVVFASDMPDVPTYARGVMRAGEWQEPHCGNLIMRACEILEYYDEHRGPIYAELCSWYRHEAGFFAGKGTAKAPCADPMDVDIVEIARAIDAAWGR